MEDIAKAPASVETPETPETPEKLGFELGSPNPERWGCQHL